MKTLDWIALILVASGLVGLLAGAVFYIAGYRTGQIDALSGTKIQYELRQNDLGETNWQSKEPSR